MPAARQVELSLGATLAHLESELRGRRDARRLLETGLAGADDVEARIR